jgi:hypothetical protein
MPYLQRDSSGRVVALFSDPPAGESEFVSVSHPEVLSFLGNEAALSADADPRRRLAESDIAMIRVLEDLLDVLIQKHIIMLTDLPSHAQKKLLSRKEARGNLLGDAGGIATEPGEIF